jgi:MFS family permease
MYVVIILTMMNLLNYVDRWVPSVVKDLFKADLKLTDFQTSFPLTSFIFVYMLASPVFGALADRWPRKVLIALGVGLWSLATGAAALAVGFWTLCLARALVGLWNSQPRVAERFLSSRAAEPHPHLFLRGDSRRCRAGIHPGWFAWGVLGLARRVPHLWAAGTRTRCFGAHNARPGPRTV